jgi:hypothetical protein
VRVDPLRAGVPVDDLAWADPLLAKHSGVSVRVRARQWGCRSEGVKRSRPYGPVRKGAA